MTPGNLDRLFAAANKFDASDLHLVAGVPPAYRVNGEIILADEDAYPGNGRLQVRNNFPADYSWQTSVGGLGRVLLDHVEYWTPAE